MENLISNVENRYEYIVKVIILGIIYNKNGKTAENTAIFVNQD